MEEKIVILGGGESGTGAAILAMKQGYDVFVSDNGAMKDEYKSLLDTRGINYETGVHSDDIILKADKVVKSPGIPDNSELILKLKEKKIPVISEIEFAGYFTNAFLICITGSNGKTTTTNMVYHILKTAGLKVGMAGNVGNSLARQVAEKDFDHYVIELSSFQLDGMHEFKADIAILLNITADHLDRYNYKLQNYINSKFKVAQNQTVTDHLIYWADDPVIATELTNRDLHMSLYPFSYDTKKGMACNIENDEIIITIDKKSEKIMSIHDLALKGRHNTFNSMAAALTGKILNIKKETIRQCLSDFIGVEHRLETVLSVHGINFINDSKATNVNSTWYAMECMTTDLIWIAGGVDKGNDYGELQDLVKKKVKAIVCLGKDNDKIKEAFSGIIATIVETDSMSEAVRSAYYLGSTGDTVLLSPACASFDLFNNYEDRGRQFKQSVRNL